MFIILGILGLITEINNMNKILKIKGLDNISVGSFLFLLSFFLKMHLNIKNTILNSLFEIFIFILFLLAVYSLRLGLIQMLYSAYKNSKEMKTKKNTFSSIILVLSQLLGLALIVAQIYEIFK